jgi:co-chaperonin GroES (HSP10)
VSDSKSTNIFQSNAQLLSGIDPAKIRPIIDRVIIEDIPDPEKIGSIVIPQGVEIGVGKKGLLRLGRVVAVGPGDKWIEVGFDRHDDVRRRAVKIPCPNCEGESIDCPTCDDTGIDPEGRLPMDVKPGDVCIVDRRKESEFFIEGKRFSIIHQQQSILAVVEE